MTAFEPLKPNDPLLSGYLQPEAMAIGDSLFNGVRSATINEGLALGAPPSQLARAFGWPSVLPDYRRPVLFDLEQFLREGFDLDRLRSETLDNADRWLEERGEWSGRRFFDNIGIAGAAFGDLHKAEAGHEKAKIHGLVDELHAAKELNFDKLIKLWFALNTAFLLNPSGEPDLNGLTPLEQVASRKPKRLFINIGSNEGLFGIGLLADYSKQYRELIDKIPSLAAELAKALEQHCTDVEHIYYNLLIRPRTIANLAPRTDDEMFQYPGKRYFDCYVGRIAALNGISGAKMKAFDEKIQKVNKDTQKAMSAVLKDRIAFVDTYAFSTTLDGKHFGDAKKVQVHRNGVPIRLSNQPLSTTLAGFRHGGLFGLDNMHPTRVGYALIAQEMVKAVEQKEGVKAKMKINLQDAYEADTLLQDPPRSWDRLGFLFSLIGSFNLLD